MEKDKKYIIDNKELMKEWDWEKNKDLDPNKLVVGSEKKHGGFARSVREHGKLKYV